MLIGWHKPPYTFRKKGFTMKKYYLFGKTGYEDEFVEEFDDKKALEAWLIANEDKNGYDCAGVNCVVYGEEVDYEIVKRSTSVRFK